MISLFMTLSKKISETIAELIDLFAPMKLTIPVNRVIQQPWITKGILKSSAILDKLYSKQQAQGP